MTRWALLASMFLATLPLACEGQAVVERCNGDVDCDANARCEDGICRLVEVEPGVSPGVEPSAEPGTPEPAANEPSVSPEPAPEPAPTPSDGGPAGNDGGPTDGGADAGTEPFDGWHLKAWPRRQLISLPPSPGGDAIEVVLPVSTTIAEQALGDESLRLVSTDGDRLLFERVPGALWVRIPTLDGVTGAQFWAYFGASDVGPAGHRADPWADARGVWHLDTEANDSSPLDNAATAAGTLSEGVVANARMLDGAVDDGIRLKPNARYIGGATTLTVAAWYLLDADVGFVENREIVSLQGTLHPVYSRVLFNRSPEDDYTFRVSANDERSPQLNAQSEVGLGDWTFLVGVADFDNNELAIFENGVELARGPMTDFVGGAFIPASAFEEKTPFGAFGSEDDGSDFVITGGIDEVRFIERALGPAEISAMHAHEIAGGTLATANGEIEEYIPTLSVLPFSPVDDAVEMVAGDTIVVDVRENDGSSLPVSLVSIVKEPDSNDLVSAHIRSDGRIEIAAIEGATTTTSFIVDVTNQQPGVVRQQRLTVEIAPNNSAIPRCHQIAVHVEPNGVLFLDTKELAQDGDGDALLVVSAIAGRGEAEIDAFGVLYTPPLEATDRDFIRVEVSDGVASCFAEVICDLDASHPPPTPATIDFDDGVDRAFTFPFAAAGVDPNAAITFDTVHVDSASHLVVTPLGGDDFTLAASSGPPFEVIPLRYFATHADGTIQASGTIEFFRRHESPEDFEFRMRIDVDNEFLSEDLLNASVMVDFIAADTDGRPRAETIRVYGPGSQALLPMVQESAQMPSQVARLRTMLPKVRSDGPTPYFWVYYNAATEAASTPSSSVWPADVVGAWSFTRGRTDQTGNGNTATSTLDDAQFVRAGVDLFDAPPRAILIPSIELVPPFTVEVSFVALGPWGESTPTNTLVSRRAQNPNSLLELAWAGEDYAAPISPPINGSMLARVGSTQALNSVMTYRRNALIQESSVIYVAAVFDQPTTPATESLLYLSADAGDVEQSAPAQGLVSFPSNSQWVVGPTSRTGGGVGGDGCDCRIRSVRFRAGTISDDRTEWQRRSEKRALLQFGDEEPL